MKKKAVTYIILSTLMIFALPVLALMAQDERTVIPAEQTINGSVFRAGQEVRVSGTVNGDLFVAGQDIVVSGTVNGDVIAAGQNITISGPVGGDVRLAGQHIILQGPIRGSATLAGQYLNLVGNLEVGRDLVATGYDVNLNAAVKRNIYGSMENMTISGTVGNNVRLYEVTSLKVNDGAIIGGNLVYGSPSRASIDPNTTITGNESWQKIVREPRPTETRFITRASITGFLISLAGLLLVWLIGKISAPQCWKQLAAPSVKQPGATLGMGLLFLLAVPVLVIFLMFTVIGIPLALISLLLYGIGIYISRIIVAQYLAEILAPRLNYRGHEFWLLLAALLVMMLAVKIPYIGWIITLAVLSLGLGSIFKAAIRRPGAENPTEV